METIRNLAWRLVFVCAAAGCARSASGETGPLPPGDNANGHAVSYTYKFCCPRLQYQTDALGYSKSYSYDPVGNMTGGTDESLRDVAYSFDGLNRQLTMTLDPGGTGSLNLTSSTAYYTPGSGSIGQCTTTTTNPAGQVIVTTFDGMGRVLSTSGNTAPVSYTYDAVVASGSDAGLVVSTVTTGSGSTVLTTSAYTDGAGRVVKTVDGLLKVTSMTFDGNSNLLMSTDPDDRTLSNSYDARNRLTQSVLSSAATTSYSFDAANNLLQVTDPDSKITRYGYDNANRRASTTYAYGTSNATTWSMTYTPLGQLQVLTKPSSATITYSYDQRELLSSRAYGGTAPSATDSFTYYPNHLLSGGSGGIYNMNVSRGTAGGIGSWYDGANRLIQEAQNFGGLTKTMSYQYTPDSLVSQITYPDGTTVIGRNYNDHRLLYQTLAGSTTQATFTYDPADRRATMAYANSTTTNWTLDANSRVTNLSTTASGGTLQAWQYGYTDAGDPLSQNDLSFGTMGEAYQYDTMHRLEASQRGQVTSGSNTIASPSSSQAWTLTAGGDWSHWTNTVGALTTTDTRTHNNLHALTKRSVFFPSLSYDADCASGLYARNSTLQISCGNTPLY
jgi:YD repeat-containing protein